MFEKISQEVALMTRQELIQKVRKSKLHFLLNSMILLILYVYFGVINQPILYCLSLFLILIVFLYQVATRAYIVRGVELILLDHLDISRYDDIIENYSAYKISIFHSKSNSEKYFYYFKKCWIHFLEGDFSSAQDDLNHIDPKTFNKINQFQYTLTYIYFDFLIKVFSKQDYKLSDYCSQLNSIETKNVAQEKLVNERLHVIEALDKIIKQHELSNYFEGGEPKNHLDQVSKTFYNALNQLNQGNTDQAKAYFQTIANENSELFYVREAKRLLEDELS